MWGPTIKRSLVKKDFLIFDRKRLKYAKTYNYQKDFLKFAKAPRQATIPPDKPAKTEFQKIICQARAPMLYCPMPAIERVGREGESRSQ